MSLKLAALGALTSLETTTHDRGNARREEGGHEPIQITFGRRAAGAGQPKANERENSENSGAPDQTRR